MGAAIRLRRMFMRHFRIWAASLAACLTLSGAVADEALIAPESNAVSDGTRVDACASDPSRLGLSRVVEIDTGAGPNFGGSHLDFLKDGEVVLTFDDGPVRRHTLEILKALSEHCTKATFFMVGRMAVSDPELVKEVAAAGHTVATHTWSHRNLRAIGQARAEKEFEMGYSAVSQALGHAAAPFFRFPYLSDNRRIGDYVKSRNVSAWWVDVDSKDYQTRSARRVHDKIMSQLAVKKKGIILLHDIQRSTVGAIHGLLDDLHAKGYKVVHIVPRTSGATLAEYDEVVGKLFKKKMAAIEANPMAKRSVVWPISSEDRDAEAGADNAASPKSRHKTNSSVKQRPAKPARTVQKQPAAEPLPWQPKPFGY